MSALVAERPSLADVLRRRASVLVEFELDWLGLDLSSEDSQDEVAEFLALDAYPGRAEAGRLPRWRVNESVRMSSAAAGLDSLHQAWQEVTHRPDHPLQRMIDRLVGAREAIALEELSRTDLELVGLVSRWYDGAGAPIPPFAEVDRRLRYELLLDPLRAVSTTLFRDREDRLATLARQQSRETILVTGRGGIGKSALLARHLLSVAETGERIAWLSFDHGVLNPLLPVGMLAELCRQLAIQAEPAVAQQLRGLFEEARRIQRRGDNSSGTASRDLRVGGPAWGWLVDGVARLIGDRRLVVVIDTLEEAQRRDWRLSNLRLLIERLAAEPGWRVIGSGRAQVDGFSTVIELDGLPEDDAVALLAAMLAADPGGPTLTSSQLRDVTRLCSTSPLCLRLAAGILRATAGDVGPLQDLALTTGVMEGELYRRLLGYIDDPDVQKLAYPGLTLRRITPALIRTVLAEPCGVEVSSREQAEDLFDGLAREAMLVERELDKDEMVLRHRSDIRPLMLQRLAKDNDAAVRRIHQAAIDYYSRRDDRVSHVEELYHRLMLGEAASTLDSHWHDDAADELRAAVEEFPPESRAYLLARYPELASQFSVADLAGIDEARRRPLVQRDVEQLVQSGDLATAAQLLVHERTSEGLPLLPLLELQVLELGGDLEAALAIGQQEEASRAKAGDVTGVVTAALHCARLLQQLGRVEEAGGHLRRLSAQLDRSASRSVDSLTSLQLLVTRLRLNRFGAASDDREQLIGDAVATFDVIPQSLLRQQPELLRDLAGELGAAAPARVLTATLDAGRLDDTDGSVANALADFDAVVSKARGREHGVLADQVRLAVDDAEPAAAWTEWLSSGYSTKTAEQVSELIKTYESEVPDALGESIARNLREASDQATDFRIE